MNVSAHNFGLKLALCGIAALLSSIALKAQDANATPKDRSAAASRYKIAGTVVNSITGTPLAQARISIAETRDRGKTISVTTEENGRFEFSQVSPGKYSLQGAKRGLITSAYDQHEQFSTAIVTGPEFATENLVLKLTPMALIAGHVFDEYGDPVRHAQVSLYLEDHRGGMTRTSRLAASNSDDRGYYEFAQLRPGKYFISVTAKPWYAVHPVTGNEGANHSSQSTVSPALDVVYPTTYYGGAIDADGASPINLKGGDRQQIEVHLNPTPGLHLTFRLREKQSGQNSMLMLQKRVFDSIEFVQPENMQPVGPGVYEVTGVPTGHYTASTQNPYTGELEQVSEVDLVRDGQEVDTSRSEPLGNLKLTIKMLGEEPAPKQFAIALQDSHMRFVAFKPADPSGQFSFEGLAPGQYAIQVAANGKLYSVARTASSAGEMVGHEVSITAGATLEATALLTAGVVSIEGVVSKKDKPAAGIMVALVPKDPEAHIELFRRDQSDFDGTFLLRGVIPGTYTIVAVEDAWDFEWLSPGVLARYVQQGQELTIGELMRGSVHLPNPVEVQPH